MSSGSKRKRTDRPTIGADGFLHPGEWGNTPKRPKSPSASGPSTPETAYSHSPSPPNPSSRSPSAMGRPEPSLPSHGLPNTSACSTIPQPLHRNKNTSGTTRSSTGGAWTGLEQALRALHITAKICPPLASAVDSLASFLYIFEAAAKNYKDYDELATGLKRMADQLARHLQGTTSEDIITTITGIATSRAIEKEVQSIDARKSRGLSHRIMKAAHSEEDLIRCYRRIEQLFRQLQGEASMNTWNTVDEMRVEQQLNSLRPSNVARFNSELSTEVSRRGCTKNTRNTILEESLAWSEGSECAKVYWMNGMAGTGKTTIAYSLCERLEARKQLAASFFCTRASPECREAKRIIPTIAYQLARRFLPFRYSLCQQLKQDPDINTGQLSDQFELLLKKPLLAAKDKLSNNLIIVVDALDECNDPHIVELFLDLLFRSVLELPIKFFVTSRPEPAIRNRMMPESERSRSILYLHEIEQSLVQADIELYLKEELASIAPADEDLAELAEHAGNLFIYAATAVRYIRPVGKAVNSKARLRSILAVGTESDTTLSAIDALYIAILTTAINDEELTQRERTQIRSVLRTAICACEPILIQTLASLSGLDDKDDTMAALQPLRSVLYVSDHSEIVTTLHASFPDFMFSQARSGVFHCDKVVHSQFLAVQCFQIMKAQLRFNICSIRSSYIPNDKIPELEEQIATNVSDVLFYTCRFWVDHLSETCPIDDLLYTTDEFLSQRLLFWMEVMSLKSCMVSGIVMLTKLNIWLAPVPSKLHKNLLELASDAQGFVATYGLSPASTYIAHIYLSALPLSPPTSSVRLQYLPHFRGLIKVSGTIFNRMEKASLGAWATDSSYCVTFLPNGDRIALGDKKGTISIQDAYEGKCIIQPFKAHRSIVASLAVSRDGTQIVSGSHDKTLSVWSTHNGSLVSGPFKGHTHQVTSVAFSPDSQLIVSGSNDRTVRIWSPPNVASLQSFTGHEKGVTSVAFSPDGLLIASGSLDHTVRLWDVSSGVAVFILSGHTGPVNSVQFAPADPYVISGSSDRTIRVWSTSDGSLFCQSRKAHTKVITSIAVSPDGSRIASGSADCTIRVWDTQSCKPINDPFEGHTGTIRSVGFSGESGHIVSVSEEIVRVWNAQGQVSQTGMAFKKGKPQDLKISASRSQTHVAFWDRIKATKVHVWDLRTMSQIVIPTKELEEIHHLQLSFDGARIHSLHVSGTICTWDTQTAKLVDGPHRFTSLEKQDLARCSPDGTRVVTCHAGKAELWHVKSNQSVTLCNPGSNLGVYFSQDGSRFTTCRVIDGLYVTDIWDGHSGALVAGPFSVSACGLSPDGTYLGAYSEESNCLIHVDTGKRVDLSRYWGGSVTFTPDGLHVAVKSYFIIDMLDIHGRKINSFKWQHGRLSVLCMEYSSDGWLLLTPRYQENQGGFHVWRFHIDHPPYTINQDGWVLDDQQRPLLWVPKDIRDQFPGCDGVIISDAKEVLQSVEYGGMLVGDDWTQCYIHDSQ
ncbi:Vegetative incompatibility protein HET-E-1 [Podospora anserina] [Rhizoctonia solani]|uniref:Vegetative incompatibility protein HET-E-1 [Podospora anserina] n=1 Tax=Rhizoctonia solani TaxID=456999 RepID=A0A0K6GD81_9AGAM|nr:Vegetative incompatibility protein HET-E-1 [Podospora anserina] [Rhizoctonia solani]